MSRTLSTYHVYDRCKGALDPYLAILSNESWARTIFNGVIESPRRSRCASAISVAGDPRGHETVDEEDCCALCDRFVAVRL